MYVFIYLPICLFNYLLKYVFINLLGLYFVLWLGFGLLLQLGLVWCYGLGKFSVTSRVNQVIPNDLRTPKKGGVHSWLETILCRFSIIYFMGLGLRIRVWVRGHVNKKKLKKSQQDFGSGWVGWVKCPIGNLKKLENIFLYIILLRFWTSIRTSITL